jgi:predicted ATP-grasp superfamily ATP-dependent carboligase
MENKKIYSLILGGYVNGYSIVRELYDNGLRDIAVFSYGKSLSSYSNKINHYSSIEKTSKSLKNAIFELKKTCDYIVIFPTDDLQLENLHAIYDEIKEFCFVPLNRDNLLKSLDKYVQYSFCEEYSVPYPKTQNIESIQDINKIETMLFPILVKPNKRDDMTTDVFRSLFLETVDEYKNNIEKLEYFINKNITFLASEFVPGDDTNIFAYTAYRSYDGKILSEWIGKKLTQYPDNFGIFSSGSNESPQIVKEQGRKLLEVMNLIGIAEPEFKFDIRDGKYKLMEINLRSMMWHRVGNLSGINIQYSQYLNAIGEKVPVQTQNLTDIVHYVYMKHEILNLLTRKGYWKHFKYNVFKTRNIEFAIFDRKDLKPFLYDTKELLKEIIKVWLKALKTK